MAIWHWGISLCGALLISNYGVTAQAVEPPDKWPETQSLIDLTHKQDATAANQLLQWLQQTPNHELAPYWSYLLSHYPQIDAAPYLSQQPTLQAYYYWWKVAHQPDHYCGNASAEFARMAHQMPEDPLLPTPQQFVPKMPCLNALNEEYKQVWAELFTRQRLYSLAQRLLASMNASSSRMLLAQNLQAQQKYREAYQVLLAVIKRPTPNPAALQLKKRALIAAGEAQHHLHQDQAAIKWWQWITPQDLEFYPEVLWQRAMLELNRDRDTQGQQWLTLLSQRYLQHPRAAEALWYLLRIAIRKQQSTQMIQLATPLLQHSALDLEIQSAARYWLAKALAKQGKTTEAEQQWQLLAQGPLNDYYTHLAQCQQQGKNCYALTPQSLQYQAPSFPLEAPTPLLDWLMHQPNSQVLEALLPFQGLNPSQRELMNSWMFLQQNNYFRSIRTIWKQKTRDTRILSLMYPLHHFQEVARNAQRFQLPHGLIAGLIWQESMYKADIRSHSGAVGLMQLMPATAQGVAHQLGKRGFGLYQLTQPAVNIEMGSFYLRQQLTRFGNKPLLALAAYNGGPHSVDRWLRQFGHLEPDAFIEQITFAETRRYVKQVLSHYWIYNTLYGIY